MVILLVHLVNLSNTLLTKLSILYQSKELAARFRIRISSLKCRSPEHLCLKAVWNHKYQKILFAFFNTNVSTLGLHRFTSYIFLWFSENLVAVFIEMLFPARDSLIISLHFSNILMASNSSLPVTIDIKDVSETKEYKQYVGYVPFCKTIHIFVLLKIVKFSPGVFYMYINLNSKKNILLVFTIVLLSK